VEVKQSSEFTLSPLLLETVPRAVIFMKLYILWRTDTTALKSREGRYSRIWGAGAGAGAGANKKN